MSSVLTENIVLSRTRSHDLRNVKKLNCWGSELKDISIVQRMPNVEVLSLSLNNIDSLQDFESCRYLQELYLRKNKISNINEIFYLQELPNLKKLSLEDNPCNQHANYRYTILKALPRLETLDNVAVTPEEVAKAQTLGDDVYDPLSEQPNYSSMNGHSHQKSIPSQQQQQQPQQQQQQQQQLQQTNNHQEQQQLDDDEYEVYEDDVELIREESVTYREKEDAPYNNFVQEKPINSTPNHIPSQNITPPVNAEPVRVRSQQPQPQQQQQQQNGTQQQQQQPHLQQRYSLQEMSPEWNAKENNSKQPGTNSNLSSSSSTNMLRSQSVSDYNMYNGSNSSVSTVHCRSADTKSCHSDHTHDSYQYHNDSNSGERYSPLSSHGGGVSGGGSCTSGNGNSSNGRRFGYQSMQSLSSQQKPLSKGGRNRNANILSAVLCLIKELDYASLEVVETAIHCRMEEMED